MPCVYDEVAGSWDKQSEGWPGIAFATEEEHSLARQLIVRDGLVPYGSYVTVGATLRLETSEYINVVQDAIAQVKASPTDKITRWVPTTNRSHLRVLGKAAEETSELGQVLARCIIQGIEEKEPNGEKTNRQWLTEEVADVYAALEVLVGEFQLDLETITTRQDSKVNKLLRWKRLLENEG